MLQLTLWNVRRAPIPCSFKTTAALVFKTKTKRSGRVNELHTIYITCRQIVWEKCEILFNGCWVSFFHRKEATMSRTKAWSSAHEYRTILPLPSTRPLRAGNQFIIRKYSKACTITFGVKGIKHWIGQDAYSYFRSKNTGRHVFHVVA